MEELDSGLNSGDYLVISQIISKLIETIQRKHKEDPSKESPEAKFLKEKCTSFSGPISQVACKGLLYLIRDDTLDVKNVLTDFISIITTTKCSSNTASLINQLLLEEEQISTAHGQYKSVYNLRLPQHPLVTMLMDNPSCWFKIYSEIVEQKDNIDLSNVYEPVYFLVFCNPSDNQQLGLFKLKLWSFLICKQDRTKKIILKLLGWMQMRPADTLRENADLLVELAEVNYYNDEQIHCNVMILFLTSYLSCLSTNNLDLDCIINILRDILETQNNDEELILNSVILILSKIIPNCSTLHVINILELCEIIVCKSVHPIALQALKVSLLQWITSPSLLTSEIVMKATQLFFSIENTKTKFKSNQNSTKLLQSHNKLINTTDEGCISIHLSALIEKWTSEEDVLKFVGKLEEAPTFFLEKIIHFIFGIFTCDFKTPEIHLRLFHVLLKCGLGDHKLQSRMLTLLIYKLSNTYDSKFHYELLKALPKLAKSRHNAKKILGVLQTITKKSGVLETFGTTLFFDLWKIDNKYYPQLESLLITPYNSDTNKGNLWEFYVTRAYVLREICKLKPEIHGKEMVAHLSKILNDCNDANGALACALAIEGITALCKVEIIDAVTTWDTLAPNFKNDTRVPVIKSLCGFFAEIPHLSYSEAYPQLTQDVIKSLWDYIRQTTDPEIWRATLSTLSSFNLEDIVAQMPEDYQDDEDVSNLKKGVHSSFEPFWINFLRKSTQSTMPLAEHFFAKMVSLEIDGYLKYVYQVKGAREPTDFSYLPSNSIVRTIGSFLKFNAQKWISSIYKDVYLECLKIFSHVYSKPLPPLDWCFLQEIMQEPTARNYCVSIASHQVMLSGTARRLIENYITALSDNCENEDEVLHLYKNLQHISNSIQPATLKPFLEMTVLKAVASFKNGDKDYLKNILKCLKATLEHKGIQDINKSVIADILTTLVEETEDDSELFMLLLNCVEAFPLKNMSQISSSKSSSDLTTAKWLKKAVKIRCRVAVKATNSPLNWLNDITEVGHKSKEIIPFILTEFSNVFKNHKDDTESALWLLDFIGQIQAAIADKCDMAQILFLCDVFMVATLIFSGYHVFVDDLSGSNIRKVFPQAIATLIDVNHWSVCANQALEWFYQMNIDQTFPLEYRELFGVALQALRHEDEFKKNLKWMKYLNATC